MGFSFLLLEEEQDSQTSVSRTRNAREARCSPQLVQGPGQQLWLNQTFTVLLPQSCFTSGQEAYSIRKYPQNAIALAATNERPSLVFRACLLRRLLWLEVRFPVRADYGLRAALVWCWTETKGTTGICFLRELLEPFTGRRKDEAR